jgi:RNA polymerase sigma-70 factor (ECF subfamily)
MGDDPDSDFDIEQTDINLSTLLGYIQELPNKYRLTFNLYVLDGYSHKEISEMLGTCTGQNDSEGKN